MYACTVFDKLLIKTQQLCFPIHKCAKIYKYIFDFKFFIIFTSIQLKTMPLTLQVEGVSIHLQAFYFL